MSGHPGMRCRCRLWSGVWPSVVVAAFLTIGAAAQSCVAAEVATPGPSAPASVPTGCPVTIPNGDVPPFGNLGFFPGPVFHGERGIWTSFGADGSVAWQPAMGTANGGPSIKFLWFHDERAAGHLQISGTVLGAAAPPLTADVPEGYGATGYQASGLNFSRLGCWRITASAGGSSLTFTIRVYEGAPTSIMTDLTSSVPPKYCHVSQAPSAGANPAATRRAPAGSVPIGNQKIVAFLPPGATHELAPAKPGAAQPYGPIGLRWWLNPAIGVLPLISAEQAVGYGASGLFDAQTGPARADGAMSSTLFFPAPGCWRVQLVSGETSATFFIWLWTRELPPAATPVATAAA